jgi:hypothetical protein
MVFLTLTVKGAQKVKKIRRKRNSFHGHFPNDFSISCIFPIEDIYHKYWEKYEFTKKKPILLRKTVPFYYSEKLKKLNFTQL